MRLAYVIIYVPDIEETVTFYENAFGVSRRFIHESGYAEMETGATALAFATEKLAASNGVVTRQNRPNEDAAAAEIAFVSNDVPTAFANAVAAGASACKSLRQSLGGKWSHMSATTTVSLSSFARRSVSRSRHVITTKHGDLHR
jgi:predicted enzyme related to lactoylglutathione lyase